MLTGQQAEVIFEAVLGMAGPTQVMFEAQAAHAMGQLSEAEMIHVVEDYVDKKTKLDEAIRTRGTLG